MARVRVGDKDIVTDDVAAGIIRNLQSEVDGLSGLNAALRHVMDKSASASSPASGAIGRPIEELRTEALAARDRRDHDLSRAWSGGR